MSQWRIDSRSAKHIYIATPDITSVIQAPTVGVRVAVKWKREYADDDRFERVGRLGNSLSVLMEAWQVEQAVQQERQSHPAFCPDCYDYGKVSAAPPACLRCTLLEACIGATGDDYRKVSRTAIVQPTEGNGRALLLGCMVAGSLWLFVMLMAQSQERAAVAEAALRRAGQSQGRSVDVRRQKPRPVYKPTQERGR